MDPVAGATQLYVSQHTPSHKHLAWQRSWADLLWILWMEHIMHSFDLCRHWLLESSCTPLNLPVDKIVEIAEVCQKVAQRHENTHTSCPTIWSLHSFKLVGLCCPLPQERQLAGLGDPHTLLCTSIQPGKGSWADRNSHTLWLMTMVVMQIGLDGLGRLEDSLSSFDVVMACQHWQASIHSFAPHGWPFWSGLLVMAHGCQARIVFL